MKNILGKSTCLNTQACSGEWIAPHHLKLLPRSPPSSFVQAHLTAFVSHAELHGPLVFPRAEISVIPMASPLQTGGRKFSFIYDYIAKQWLIFQLVQLVHLFLCNHDTQGARSIFQVWRPPKGNQTYKMLHFTCYDLLPEVWKRRQPEKNNQSIPNTWNMTHKTKEIPLEHILAHKTRRKCKSNRAISYVLRQLLDPASFLSTLSVYFNLLTNLLKKLFTHGDEISYLFYSLSNFEQYGSYPKFHQNCFIKHIFNSFNKYFTPDILLCASIRQWTQQSPPSWSSQSIAAIQRIGI